MTKLAPLYNRVVVQVIEAPTTTPSGLALPESQIKASQNTGTVVAVGPGNWRTPWDGEKIPMNVKVGDTVLFSPANGLPFSVGGKSYLIFDESSILAVLE